MRKTFIVLLGAIVSSLTLLVAPSQAATDNNCDYYQASDPSVHCYVLATQGYPARGLNGLSEVGAWINSECMEPLDQPTTFVTNEMWIATPLHTGTTVDEWVEAGQVRGVFIYDPTATHPNGVPFSWFWARQWYDGTPDGEYDEYIISSYTPSYYTNYVTSLKYVSGDGWRMFLGTNRVGGGFGPNAPGTGMHAIYGTEAMVDQQDGSRGKQTNIYRVVNGVTYNGAGGQYYDPSTFEPKSGLYPSTGTFWPSSTEVNWRSLHAGICV